MQQSLFDPVEKNTREKTNEWIKNNPKIYEKFVEFSLQAARAGKPFGIALIRERIRWTVQVEWKGEYKIQNSYSPYIARRLIKDYPHLGDFIKTKQTKF